MLQSENVKSQKAAFEETKTLFPSLCDTMVGLGAIFSRQTSVSEFNIKKKNRMSFALILHINVIIIIFVEGRSGPKYMC